MSGISLFRRRPPRKSSPARGGTPRRAAGTAGTASGRPGLRKALRYAAAALALLLFAPAAFAQSVTLSVSNITMTTLDLTIANHSGSWYWKATDVYAGTSGDCSTEVTGTKTTATGLTKKTYYYFTAYSNNSCSSQLAQSNNFWTDGFDLNPPQGFYTEGTHTSGAFRVTVPSGLSEALTATLTTDDTNNKVTLSHSTLSFAVNGTKTVNVTATLNEDDDGKTEQITVTGTVTVGQSNLLGDTDTSIIVITDDDADFTLSATTVALTEGGGNGTYTLKLAADPVDDTTVTVTSNDTGAVTVDTDGTTTGNQSEVTFTGGSTGNWNTARTITLTPVDDADETDESVTITHAVKNPQSSDFDAADKTLSAPVVDDDATRLAASNVEDDTATLTLTNHTGDWYYKYTVPSSPPDTCSTVVSTGTYTKSLTNLTTATSYTYKAYSNSTCTAEVTSDATDAEFLTKPGQVTGVSATADNASLAVSWTALTGTVTGYKVQWKKGNENYTSARTNTVTGGSSTTSTITGLTNNTQYTVRVTAWNATGDGDASSEVTGTPVAPTLAASNVEDDTATLTLTNHSGDWYYKYTVPSSPADTCSTVVSSGTYTASLSSLTPATSYTYKAYSNNTCTTELTSATTDAEFLTKPGQVTGVSAGSGNTTLEVSWTALTGTVTGYKVQWKKGDESYTSGRTNTVTSGTTNSITGLTNGTRYTVRVTAYNATGDGDASSEVTATPRSGFGFNDTVDDQTWAEGTAVNFTLPAANTQGCRADSNNYSLTPSLPGGLSFNSASDSRLISGTPTAPIAQTRYTYSSWNEQCYKTASLTFNITITGAIELSAASVSLTEGGGNQSYNVKLGAQPNANATISITTGDAGAVTVSPTSLTFTTTNWGTNQAVTLTPVNDTDGGDEAVTITHTAAGGGIGGKTASLTANVTDDDKGITLSKTSYTIREGTEWHDTHTVVLDTAPAGNVTVTETVTPSNLHQLLERSPRSLTFTTSNWNLPQQIEMKVANNANRTRNAAGSMVHTSSGGGYGGATATLSVVYIDNQTPGLTISPGTLSVAEGSTGTFTVKLGGAPNGNVTVAVTSGDTGAATVNPSSLTFTTTASNWSTNQTVTVTTVQDADGNNETVALTSTAAGGGFDSVSGAVTLTVTDDEKALLASNVTHSSAILTITNHTGDWYYKKTVPSGDTTCTPVSSGTYTASLSGLTPATSYTYKAYSNSACSTEITSAATDAEFLTKPAKVTGVTAAGAADAGALDVGWTAVIGAASYKVQWKTSSQQWATSRQTTSTTTSKTISNLTGGTQYSVRVAAVNTSGDGPWSDTATGTAATDGVTLSTTSLSVPEGGSAGYTVVLDTTPSHTVTIAVAKQSGGDADLTVSPASLSFSTTNWNAPQTVTVTAKQDSDTTAGAATITHTATSSDSKYSGVTIDNLTATEDEDDAHGVLVSKTAVSVPEGGSAAWTVRLATVPSADVLIDVAKQAGGDGDLTFSPAQLTFTTKGWDLPQTVTVSAAEDTDAARGTATFTHAATSTDASYGGSLTIANVTATEDDDELGVTVSKKAVSVPEGGSATWTVVLDGPPTANVTIAVAKKTGGDGNLTASPASFTFTSTNWSSAQTVTVSAAQDSDETDGTATFTHTATSTDTDFNGLAIASVTATEDEDDRPGVTVSKTSVSVTEGSSATYTVVLDTAPSANVTIAVAKQSGGDADLTASPASLTFTSTNWNQAQTVTVSAAEDDSDEANGTATFTHTASSTDTDYGSSLTIASVTATEADNDTLAGVTLSKTSLTVAEGGSATYTVVLDTAPSANVTIAVANRGQSADDSDLTVSPASLTFTSTNWNSAQTVTVSAAQDADDADGTAVVTHTATSTDASYGGIAIANVTATEDDDETPGAAPTSADVTLAVSRDNRTAIPLSSFPFSDEDSADTLRGVKVVTLPGASDGTLGLAKTGIYAGASTVLCVGTITPIVAGQEVLDAVSTVLYFCPKDGFDSATFEFQVIDSQGRASEKTYTATLVGPPGQVTGLEAEAGSTYVRLRWTDPENPAITGYEYRQKSGAGVTTWGAWKAMTGSGAATTSYAVSGLTNATAYTFQVRAKSAGGAGPLPSAEVTATPSSGVVPAKTTGLQGVNLGFNTANTWVRVRLVWDDPKDPSITRYEAERQLNATTDWIKPLDWTNTHVPSSGPTTTSAEFDAGSNQNTYAFRVRAVNAAGNGPWSDTVSVALDSEGETPVLESVEPGERQGPPAMDAQRVEPAGQRRVLGLPR